MKKLLVFIFSMLMLSFVNSNAQNELNLSKYRKKLKVNTDKLSGDKTCKIPKGLFKPIQFRKSSKGNYYMALQQGGSGIYTGTGVTLYFEDGSEIKKSDKVDYNENSLSSTLLSLTDDEWEKVKTINLKGIKMHMYDIMVKKPEKIRAYAHIIREQ